MLLGLVGDQYQRLATLARGGQKSLGDGEVDDMTEDDDGPLWSSSAVHGESP
jgi:hypothetical protein